MPATKKLVTLSSDEIAAKLDAEPNMSAVVEAVLARHYGVTLEGEGVHIDQRREVLESLGDYPLAYQEPAEPQMLTEADPDETAAAEFITAHTEPAAGFEPVEQPQPETPAQAPSVVDQLSETLPVYEETTQAVVEENTVEPVEESGFVPTTLSAEEVDAMPDAEPQPPVDPTAEPVINVMGQPGNVCDIHGAYIGSICIDCL